MSGEFGRPVSVRDYGARGDGEHDDGPAIRRASTVAWDRGTEVYFPPGTYRVGTRAPEAVNGQ